MSIPAPFVRAADRNGAIFLPVTNTVTITLAASNDPVRARALAPAIAALIEGSLPRERMSG